MSSPDPTPSEMLNVIKHLVDLLEEGKGIVLARKIACGGLNNKKSKALSKHDLYVYVLNQYMIRRDYRNRYKKEDGKLRAILQTDKL